MGYNAGKEKGGAAHAAHCRQSLRSLSILYRKSHIWLSEGCAPCGLTAAQAVVILVVCDHGALTQDEITKRLSLDKSVVAKTVAKLEETGFLSRRTNPKDKRTYDIHPTEKAMEVYPASCRGRWRRALAA